MQLPENVQPVVSAIGKYHFWILAVLVPLLIVPMLVLANSDISKRIDDAQGNIQSKLSAVQSVRSTSPHPNQEWADAIEEQTLGIRQATWQSWDQAYRQQLQIRVWPDQLGPQFLRYVDRIGPDDELPLTLRELYQNSVPSIVRSLPARMGAEDLMESASGMGMMGGSEGMSMGSGMGSGGMSRRSGGSMSSRRGSRGSGRFGSSGGEDGGFMGDMGPRPMVDWSAADQGRVYQSFVWDQTPSTTQILLAQEELWVYGVLCDAIALANIRSTGHYNAAIPTVEQMLIGYQAAEDQPGGEGTGRIMVPGASDTPMSSGMGGMGSSMEMMSMSGSGGTGGQGSGLVRPPHPRFDGAGGGTDSESSSMSMSSMGMMGSGGPGGRGGASTGSGSGDDALYNWIYVDFDGKPLTKSQIDASPTNRMLRLMPFMLRIRIGEQKLDDFLVELATQAPVPIDVRQVRINPEAAGAMGGGEGMGMGMGGMGGRGPSRSGRGSGGGSMGGRMSSSMGGSEGMMGMGMGGDDGGRPNDLDVEIRGTIAIVAQPDAEVVGLAEDEIPLPQDQLPVDGGVGPANTEDEPLSEGDVS